MEVKEFLSAALPLVLTGIALAVLAASAKKRKIHGAAIAMGAALGLLLGVALNSCGLWESHAIGLAFGPLWGMALGAIYKGAQPPEKSDMDRKQKELQLWEAAKNRDSIRFLELVCTDAVMICGGFRCSGLEYSLIIKNFDLAEYVISDFEVVHEADDVYQVHYCIETFVEDTKNADLQGAFHITSTWKRMDGDWKLIFNMDSRKSS